MTRTMKNYLIITLGTRDVQILSSKLEPNGWEVIQAEKAKIFKISKGEVQIEVTTNSVYKEYLLVNPRKGGRYILENLESFLPIIELPLIQPLLNLLHSEQVQITDYLLIYTDQDEAKIQEYHFNNDTCFFKDIIAQVLKENTLLKGARADEYGILEEVANIDYQYDHFAASNKELLTSSDDIREIFLLPQGGIEQINHAITLQLLQAFKNKVRLFQQPEAPQPVELTFPQKFLRDLNKQKIIKHLEDYDFDKAEALMLDETPIKRRLQYAARRLNLDYTDLWIEELGKVWEDLTSIEQKRIKIQDLTYHFKIQMRQAKYNDALTKLYTIYENLFKQIVDEYLGEDTRRYYIKNITPPNQAWLDRLSSLSPTYLEQLQKKKIGKKPLDLINPNAFTYFCLALYLSRDQLIVYKEEQIKKIDATLQNLRDIRNSINHSMGTVLRSEIDEIFVKQNMSQDQFYRLLDGFTQTNSLGWYEKVRQEGLGYYS